MRRSSDASPRRCGRGGGGGYNPPPPGAHGGLFLTPSHFGVGYFHPPKLIPTPSRRVLAPPQDDGEGPFRVGGA